MPSFLLLALLQGAPSTGPAIRDPAFASDGRLAVATEGDLWLRRTSGGWTRLTSGAAWDRSPAWSADGSYLVFVSNREGEDDLWKLPVSRDGGTGTPERLTRDAAPDLEPAVARDGTVYFVRGRGSRARLWRRSPGGTEERVTRGENTERWPSISPDGKRVAYVQFTETGRRLRVRPLDSANDSVVVGDRAPERPTWSPSGDRVAFFSQTPRPGVYVSPLDGRYVNLVTARRAMPAWAPDGRTILLAERTADEPGYNGDPDRIGDRAVAEVLVGGAELVTVPAPVAPDDGTGQVSGRPTLDRTSRNADVFDRTWARIDQTYFQGTDASDRRAAWAALRDRYRPRALAAGNDLELERVLHAMVRERPPIRREAAGRAAISSAHPVATAAGLEILQKGGNVVDAAVAVSFALGVVEPDASGIGGYGEMLVFMNGMEKPALIEFMSRVPEEGSLSNAALLQDGRYPSDGPVLAMVPGTVHGMHTAFVRYGSKKVSWADVVAPAIRAARDGYAVSDGLATTLERERDAFLKYEGSKALFFRNGEPLRAGDTLKNPDLAWVLEQVAKQGADGFYKGEVARRLVQDLRGKGNAMRLTDMARYFAADREPVRTSYRGRTVYSSAPPASGGAMLAAQLNMLEQLPTPRPYPDDASTLHAMIAAWQLVPSSRGRIADPSLWPVNVEPFTSKDTARVRWRCFDAGRALTPSVFRGDTLVCPAPGKAASGDDLAWGQRDECEGRVHAEGAVCRPNGTTAFAVADAEGNAVAVTQTLGTWGGNFYVTPGLGFLYNDKLTSYGTDPNGYGARLPFARHGSTLAPTVVTAGSGASHRAVLALGAAGNAWITSAVYQTLVGVLDFGLGPQRALELPRFLPSQRAPFGSGGAASAASREYVVDMEDGYDPNVIAALRSMGYQMNFISLKGELRMGYGAAVSVGGGMATAGGDPRRSGAAGAIP